MGSSPTGSTKHRRRKWWTRTPDKRVISRFDSCPVHQLWVVGRAVMQPPFKRTHPGSTPGQPTKIWAFGRTVMHLPLKETDVGSTPTAPTKPYPCDAIGRRVRLKTGIFASSSLARGIAGIEQERLGSLISCIR